jgi:hypothetical protein
MAISNMLPQIWSARILAKLEKNLVFAQPGVVNRDYEGDIRADGDRVHIHSFNDLTIGTYTKNSTTITYEQLTDTRVTLLIDLECEVLRIPGRRCRHRPDATRADRRCLGQGRLPAS